MFEVDSYDYDVLERAADKVKGLDGISCEIGVRRGGATAKMLYRYVQNGEPDRLHICIDPYGNIEYVGADGRIGREDYTNDMRNDCLKDMYTFQRIHKTNVQFFILEDTEFMKRFADGVPVYNETKRLMTTYAIVHFDGPHDWINVLNETKWFHERSVVGSVFVYDDLALYDHSKVEEFLFANGWELIEKGRMGRKGSYVRTALKETENG